MAPLRDFDRLKFGSFEADLSTGELFRSGRRVPLQERPFQLLLALLTKPGELFRRVELIARFWPGSVLADDDSLNTAVRKIRRALGDDARYPKYIETVGQRGYRFIMPVRQAEREQSGSRMVIGVLGIEELTSENEPNFLRGIVDEIIVQLGRLNSHVAVLSLKTCTSMDDVEVERAIRQCRVDYFLACSARRAASSGAPPPRQAPPRPGAADSRSWSQQRPLRIIAKLIRGSDRRVRWAESLDYVAADTLTTMEDAAARIADAALHSLGLNALRRQTARPAALEAFVKAQFLWSKRTPASLRKALELYQQAVSQDDKFALAPLGLAQTHLMLAILGVAAPRESLHAACNLARDLMASDGTMGEPLVVLAWAELVIDRDWQQAEADFQRAIRLLPKNPGPHAGYAYLLLARGRLNEAISQIRAGLSLDPLSLSLMILDGIFRLLKGDYLGAQESLQGSLELEPHYALLHSYLGLAYSRLGEMGKAIAAARRAVEIERDFALPLAHLALVCSSAHKQDEAQGALNSLLALRERSYVPAYALAIAYAAVEDSERALQQLERADEERCSWILFAALDPAFQLLRQDKRFLALLDRIGLPRP